METGQSSVKPPLSLFMLDQYVVRRKIFKLVGSAFHVFDPAGQVVAYSKMKGFKLKEDIRLFTGEDMQSELLGIQARQILDISATYDVTDARTGEKVGALRRKGMKSIIKDEWVMLDAQDREIGLIKEDHMALALVRRFVTPLIPQSFSVELGGQQVAVFKQNFNPFVMKITVDFTPDRERKLDRRLGMAATILLCAIEGRQN